MDFAQFSVKLFFFGCLLLFAMRANWATSVIGVVQITRFSSTN